MSGLKPGPISETTAKPEQKQIPCGNDNQRSNGKDKPEQDGSSSLTIQIILD
jgi:hypothetical protein